MAMVLTQVYLEEPQKKALSALSKRSGRNVSELLRDAVDATLMGVTPDDIKMLDLGTKRAKTDIDAMLVDLKQNALEHGDFMRQIESMRQVSS